MSATETCIEPANLQRLADGTTKMLGDDSRGSDLRFGSRVLPEGLASARIARLLDVWREQCAGRAMPPPELARFEPFAFAVGHLHLIDVRPDGSFFYRIFGTASSYPLDFHKRSTAEIQPAEFRNLVEGHYRECVAAGKPILREISIDGARRTGRFVRVLLPYGESGAAPTLLIAGIEEESGISDVFRDPAFMAGTARLAVAGRA